MGLALGTFLEWSMWVIGRTPKLTTRQVKYSSMTRYYDCGKAKRRLGYKPVVELGEGIKRAVAWHAADRLKEAATKAQ